jgi:hypothetical protein
MDFVTPRIAELIYRTNFPLEATAPRLASGSLDPQLAVALVDGQVNLSWKNWDSEPLDDRNGNRLYDQGNPSSISTGMELMILSSKDMSISRQVPT